MDGLVTNTALVAGVGGGGAAPRAIVLAGVASLVAGAISMALGEYTSVKTQNEQLDLEVDKERRELERNPEGELAELVEMLRVRGVDDGPGPRGRRPAVPRPGDGAAAARRRRARAQPRGQALAAGRRGLVVPDLRARRALPAAALPVRRLGAVGRAGLRRPRPGRRRRAVVAASPRGPWWYAGLRQLLFGAVAAGRHLPDRRGDRRHRPSRAEPAPRGDRPAVQRSGAPGVLPAADVPEQDHDHHQRRCR